MYKIKLEKFEGPLDLLLKLIEEQKLDISEIALAQITDQYLKFLDEVQESSPEELADFLVVAAKLLLIKSRILIPELTLEGEEETSLEDQLKIYRVFYLASKRIHKIILKRKWSYTRPLVKYQTKEFIPPSKVNVEILRKTFIEVLQNIEPIIRLPQEVIKKSISLKEKIEQIQKLISQKSRLSFNTLIKESKTRLEIVITFLALLELIKQKEIVVLQDQVFEEIVIVNNHSQNYE